MSLSSQAQRALDLLRSEGLGSVSWRTGKWLSGRFSPFAVEPLSAVFPQDITAVDLADPELNNATKIPQPKNGYDVAWLISPPSRTSGGHQNAFRFLSALEQAGHRVTVYLYSTAKYPKVVINDIRQMMAETTAYPTIQGEFKIYDPTVGIEGDPDALFACDWATAYAVRRHPGRAKRFYFAQDFEPAFYAWGSDFVAAENSYRLGLHGFSAGLWLAAKLRTEYDMSCDGYEYGVDSALYRRTNSNRRTDVLFYARPPTPRRATEFGLLALAELHRQRPEIGIHIVGWDMSGYEIPFPYINHAALDIAQLNAVYNQCAAGLLLSLTNPSLVPLEAMGAGVVPVVNDGENTRGLFGNFDFSFAQMTPKALAAALLEALDRPDQVEHSAAIAKSVSEMEWSDPGAQFIAEFVTAMTKPIRRPSQSKRG